MDNAPNQKRTAIQRHLVNLTPQRMAIFFLIALASVLSWYGFYNNPETPKYLSQLVSAIMCTLIIALQMNKMNQQVRQQLQEE